MIPFLSGPAGFLSTSYSDGSPAQVGIVGLGGEHTAAVTGGLSGTIIMEDFYQYGFALPVNCLLDTVCLTVGNPAFDIEPGQTVHAFMMLATADTGSQQFTLHPATRVDLVFEGGASHPTKIETLRVAGLGFPLKAATRFLIVCGHCSTGAEGSAGYTFNYSGTLLFK